MKSYKILAVMCLLLLVACQNESEENKRSSTSLDEKKPPQIESLPMLQYTLEDLSGFTTTGNNWVVVGEAYGDFQEDFNLQRKPGTGILLNSASVGEGSAAVTNLEHGDIELEIEVLVPKRSNSGIYFQSRYELQIIDSAEDDNLSSDDMGGIYDQGEGKPGIAPMLNAARSAGLWQKLKVLFRAPRFDDMGKKTKDAMFEHVYLNGALIQQNASIPQPTRGAVSNEEVAKAPLFIQGDHGPVAYRNMRYKVYDASVNPQLSNITYKTYQGKYDYIPDFDKMEVDKEGSIENFDDLSDLAGQREGFSIEFEGDLLIKTAGTYLFETYIDDGGNLYIDDVLIVHNQGEPGGGIERGVIDLEAGSHKLKQSFYQEVWNASLRIRVEGPGVEAMELPARLKVAEDSNSGRNNNLEIEVGDTPEIIRAFVDHNGVKKTHVVSVGTKEGVHYNFDTRRNQLLNIWKGKFADAGEMWINRGSSQRLRPMNATVEIATDERLLDFKPLGYTIGTDGLPVFQYQKGKLVLSDKVEPTANNSAIRTITAEGDSFEFDIAVADNIEKLENGWYNVNGQYFVKLLKVDQLEHFKEVNGDDRLSATMDASESIQFEIKW